MERSDPGTARSLRRTATWVKDDPPGIESVAIVITGDRLVASGFAMGTVPEPYRLEYELETGGGFVTSRLDVAARGSGWSRALELFRSDEGIWSATASSEGDVALPPPGGDLAGFGGALDVDLGLSPTTNTTPVLRHDVARGGESGDLVMTWVSVPDLGLHHSEQSYSFRGSNGSGRSIVRFVGTGPWGRGFTVDLTFDPDGLVAEYPGLAHRVL